MIFGVICAYLVLFIGCKSLDSANTNQENESEYENEKNFVVEIVDTFMIITRYTGKNKNVRIPPEIQGMPVIGIWKEAFRLKNITSVSIPDTVIFIEDNAFLNSGLTSVTIGNNVTSIGDWAFCNNKLTEITIPESVTSIGVGAFDTNKLTEITIPESITSIGMAAFNKNNLTNVTVFSNTSIGKNAFGTARVTVVLREEDRIAQELAERERQEREIQRQEAERQRQEELQRQAAENAETRRLLAERAVRVREQLLEEVRYDGAYVNTGTGTWHAIRFVNREQEPIKAWVITYNDREGYGVVLADCGINDSGITIFSQGLTVSSNKNSLQPTGTTSTFVFRPFAPLTGKTYSLVRRGRQAEILAYGFPSNTNYIFQNAQGRVINDPNRKYIYSSGEISSSITIDGEDGTPMYMLTEIGPFLINGVGGIWKQD